MNGKLKETVEEVLRAEAEDVRPVGKGVAGVADIGGLKDVVHGRIYAAEGDSEGLSLLTWQILLPYPFLLPEDEGKAGEVLLGLAAEGPGKWLRVSSNLLFILDVPCVSPEGVFPSLKLALRMVRRGIRRLLSESEE